MHPEYQKKPAIGCVRAGSRLAVQTTTGRGRVNIYGALNLETFDVPFVDPNTVNGISALQILAKTEARNPDMRLIHVTWDNASYHNRPDARDFLTKSECSNPFTPNRPYLNPIDRIWAVMHQSATDNRHYSMLKTSNTFRVFIREALSKEVQHSTKRYQIIFASCLTPFSGVWSSAGAI